MVERWFKIPEWIYWRLAKLNVCPFMRGPSPKITLDECHHDALYALAYTALRIIRKPLINSQMPSSSEYFVRYPVASMRALETM
jgi:hypothetical protein